jgi:protein CpxP
MNDSSKIKWLAGTTVLLIVLNVVLLGFMWFRPHPPRPDRGGPSAAIIRELKFDDAQRSQFEKLRDVHHNMMVTIQEKDRHTHDALFALLKDGDDASPTADSLINEIAQNRKQIETLTYHHIADVRKLCTPDQQKKFDEIIINMMTRMNQGPRPPQER